MNNELAIPEQQSSIAVSDEAFKDLAKSSKFLPRLTLTAPLSDAVMEGKIGAGRWGLLDNKNIDDLGPEIRGWVVALRLKAMDTKADPIVSYYDANKPEFKTIAERSMVEKEGPLAGPEFLIYLPDHKQFCSLFMCSKTMRREAPNVKALLRKKITLKVTLITNKTHKWYGPVATPCSLELSLPEQKVLDKTLHDFMNPPENAVEEATAADKAATGREV